MIVEESERVLCVKKNVYVFKVPPRQSNRALRAADWDLTHPDWVGSMRMIAKGKRVVISLVDSGTGVLFANCPLDSFPTTSVEPVSDSSRYFVLKVVNDDGRYAFAGIGFVERSDSFDFNVTLQDFFTKDKKMEEMKKEFENQPKLDLSLKEGQKMKFRFNDGVINQKKGEISSSNKVTRNSQQVLQKGEVCVVRLPSDSPKKVLFSTQNYQMQQKTEVKSNNFNDLDDLFGSSQQTNTIKPVTVNNDLDDFFFNASPQNDNKHNNFNPFM